MLEINMDGKQDQGSDW